MSVKDLYKFELDLEKKWRKTKFLIPLISIGAALLWISGVWVCEYFFSQGYWWTIFPAGLFAHAFFIIAVHDAAHNNITRTNADRWILNIAGGLMIMPFFGEAFKNSHLIHHGNSNSENDPLWHSDKAYLYNRMRWFYVLCEMVPLLFHGYLAFRSSNARKAKRSKIKGPGIRYEYMILGAIASAAIIIFIWPSGWFVLGMILVLNVFATVRHWCEHLGTDPNGSNNTFWYPLGMGIGNHDTHHFAAFISWPVLMVGLWKRKKSSNPFKATFGVLFNKNFVHYTEEGNMIGKRKN